MAVEIMQASIKLVRAIVVREVKDQFRDWRITIPILFLTAVFPFIIGFVSDQVVHFVQSYDAEIIAENLIPFFLLVVGFFPITVSLVIAIESFVGEKERRSIEPLLSSPLEDWQLYLGKLIAVTFPPLFGSFIGMTVYMASTYLKFGFITKPDLAILVVCLTVVQALVMVSGAVVISTQATTVRSANLLASFIVVPMAFLIQWEAIEMFWGDYRDLWWIALALIVLAILFSRMGISHFNREELLGQEFDTLNIRWMLELFKTDFFGDAKSVGEWYKREIPKTIKSLSLPVSVLLLLFVGTVVLGIHLAHEFPFPLDANSIEHSRISLADGLSEINLVSSGTLFFLWFQNLRALILGTLLGIFSFGVIGMLVILFPFAVLAYFMATLADAGIPMWKTFVGAVLPHGIFEIPAILLTGAAILRIGGKFAAKSEGESITEGLLHALTDWAKIVIGIVIPLLLAAAAAEAFITPKIAGWLLTP